MNEVPTRATPFSTRVLLALIGKCILDDDLISGAGLVLAFQAMLRTTELLMLRVGHISLAKIARVSSSTSALPKEVDEKVWKKQ